MSHRKRLLSRLLVAGALLFSLSSLLACQLWESIFPSEDSATTPEAPRVEPSSVVQGLSITNALVSSEGVVAQTNRAAPLAPTTTALTTGSLVVNLLPTITPEPTPDPRGAVIEARYVGRIELPDLNGLIRGIYSPDKVLPAQYAIDEYELRFRSYDLNNQPLTLLTQLFVPHVTEVQRFPLFVVGAGTTGIDDHCAPSLEDPAVRNLGNYRAHLLTYATQGYLAALPDYEGFNDPARIHHYFVTELEGRALLDTARAIYHFFSYPLPAETRAQPAAALFFAGYSQGGHAAFAARDIAAVYAPELAVSGVIGQGPTTDIATLLREGPHFAPYLIYAYADLYGAEAIDANAILLPQWSANLEADVLARCVDQVFADYPNSAEEIYQPAFREALYSNRLGETFPQVQARFIQNSSGLVPGPIPALILQGLVDTIVTPASQQAFVDAFCATGGRLTYLTYPDIEHFDTRQVSYPDTLAWMAQILRGEIPPSVCGN